MKQLHMVWVNETADSTGGCERYVRETAALLHEHQGVRSTLLYRDVSRAIAPEVPAAFSGGVFPLVALREQLTALRPDVLYLHRLTEEPVAIELACLCQELGIGMLRFFHDHQLFCPREHKYTVRDKQTCTRPVGVHCFSCGGVLNKSGQRFRLTLPMTLQARHRALQQHELGFVVGSRYMAEHLKAHGFAPERIHTLPLYAQAPQLPRVPAARRDPSQLVFAGQLGATGKGVDTLLKALALTKSPARLAIYGTGKFETRYKALSEQLGLTARVDWKGKGDALVLEEAFRSAAAVVVPSRSPETFGLVGPEALRYGTPVIGTQVGGMGEWLIEGTTGLSVPSNDPAALALAIDRLLSSFTLRDRLGEGALRHYQQRFTPRHHTEALLTLLRSIL